MAFINKEQVKEIRNALKKEFPEIKFSVRKEYSDTVYVSILKSPYDFSDLPDYRQHSYTNVDHFRVPDCTHRRLLENILKVIKTGSSRKWVKEICFGDYIYESFFINVYVKGYEREV